MLVLSCSSPKSSSLEMIGRAWVRAEAHVEEGKFEAFRIRKTLQEEPTTNLLTSMTLKRGEMLRFRFVLPYYNEDLIQFTDDLVHVNVIEFRGCEADLRETEVIVKPPIATMEAPLEERELPRWPMQASVFASLVPYLDLTTVSRLAKTSRYSYELMSDPMFWKISGAPVSTDLSTQVSLPPAALCAATYGLPVGEEELSVPSGDSTLSNLHKSLPSVVKTRLLVAVEAEQAPINLFCGQYCDLADQGIPCSWIEGTDFGWAKRFVISGSSLESGSLRCISGSGHNTVRIQYCLA